MKTMKTKTELPLCQCGCGERVSKLGIGLFVVIIVLPLGKKCLKKHKQNMSKARIEKETFKGKNNPNFGKITSKKTKQKLSIALSGENNPAWNPKLTDKDRQDRRLIPEYSEWRTGVFEQANYTCEVCGDKTGGNLEAHHLYSYMTWPELRTLLENGVCLCERCHKNFHHQHGYGDNTKEQFIEFKEKYVGDRE